MLTVHYAKAFPEMPTWPPAVAGGPTGTFIDRSGVAPF
jgi:hypothetical protein